MRPTREVVKVEHDGVELIADRPPASRRSAPFRLTLASAVPKGDRFDWLVEKATELGIERLIPIVTERSVALAGQPETRAAATSHHRGIEAMPAQSTDDSGPTSALGPIGRTSSRLDQVPGRPGRNSVVAMAGDPAGQSVILAVGPEGGFTPAEVERRRASRVARDQPGFHYLANRDRRTGRLCGLVHAC